MSDKNNSHEDKQNESKQRILNSIILQKEALKYLSKERKLLDKFSYFFPIILTTFLFLFSTLGVIQSSNSNYLYVNKKEIQNETIKLIKNGGDLRALRNLYDNRKIEKREITSLFSKSNDYYEDEVSLSKILEDVRTSLFANGTDLKEVGKIDRIIKEHAERNPFETLEITQKDIFENLRLKSGKNYTFIQIEVNKLAAEIEAKNALVNKYLNLSNTSFWISIFALFVSLVIGIFQIYQNRSSRLQKYISTALAAWSEGIENSNKNRK